MHTAHQSAYGKLYASSGQGLLEIVVAVAIFGSIAAVLMVMALGGFRGLQQGG